MSKANGNCVITMYEGGTVMIGEDVTIVVKKYSGSQIRLAINAPREMRIERIPVARKEENANGNPEASNSKEIPVFRKRAARKNIQSGN